jgi:hypothetical protein
LQSILASDQISGHSIGDDERLKQFEECAPVDWRGAAPTPAPPYEEQNDRDFGIARSQDDVSDGKDSA